MKKLFLKSNIRDILDIIVSFFFLFLAINKLEITFSSNKIKFICNLFVIIVLLLFTFYNVIKLKQKL